MDDHHIIEKRTIQPVPEDERYGRARDLFTMWFAASVHPLALVTGALSTTALGLSLGWAIAAIILGLGVGGVLMALHSAQGPQLGLAQMIQSRGQFGSYGALLLVLITIAMYLGFFASTIAVGGEALTLAWPGFGDIGGTIVAAVIGCVVAALGYKAIHIVGRWIAIISGGLMIIAGVWYFFLPNIADTIARQGEFTAVGFFAMVAVGAIWMLAYGPYVSDYSRYMPATYGGRKSTFWATYIGGVSGAFIPMLIGAALGIATTGDVLASVTGIYGHTFGTIFLLGTGIVLVHINAMNLYGGVLCIVTAVQTFKPAWSPRAPVRAITALGFATLAFLIATLMSDNLMDNFLNFIDLLLYAMIPWSAINLADFYLVRKGKYDLQSLTAADGGIYGKIRKPAVIAFFIGLVAQIPFSTLPFFSGPVAELLGGVDIAWMVGFAAAWLSFLILERFGRQGAPTEDSRHLVDTRDHQLLKPQL